MDNAPKGGGGLYYKTEPPPPPPPSDKINDAFERSRDRINEGFNDELNPFDGKDDSRISVLAPLGFKKTGNTYRLVAENGDQSLIEFQRTAGRPPDVAFFVNVAVAPTTMVDSGTTPTSASTVRNRDRKTDCTGNVSGRRRT